MLNGVQTRCAEDVAAQKDSRKVAFSFIFWKKNPQYRQSKRTQWGFVVVLEVNTRKSTINCLVCHFKICTAHFIRNVKFYRHKYINGTGYK